MSEVIYFNYVRLFIFLFVHSSLSNRDKVYGCIKFNKFSFYVFAVKKLNDFKEILAIVEMAFTETERSEAQQVEHVIKQLFVSKQISRS